MGKSLLLTNLPDNYQFSTSAKKFMNEQIKYLFKSYYLRSGKKVNEILFIPYAYDRSSDDFNNYLSDVKSFFNDLGVSFKNIMDHPKPLESILESQAITIGGGNLYYLLNTLSDEMLDLINQRVNYGIPYIGWNEGSVISCPSYIGNYNEEDLLINAVPFQTYHHYIDTESVNEKIFDFLEDEYYSDPDLRAPIKHVVCFKDEKTEKEKESSKESGVRIEEENVGMAGYDAALIIIYQLIDGELKAISFDPESIPII